MKRRFDEIVCIAICIVLMIPLILLIINSFSSNEQSVTLSPMPLTIKQYTHLFFEENAYWRGYFNSILITSLILPIQIMGSIVTGYVFAKVDFIGKKSLWRIYLIAMVLPFESTILPNFLLMKKLALFDNWSAIWFPMIVLPFPTVIMRRFIQAIDNSYFDEFSLSSSSKFRRYLHVIIPLSSKGILVVTMLSFAELWGMIEQPMTYLNNTHSYPLSVLLGNDRVLNGVKLDFAGCIIFLLPMMCLYYLYLSKIANQNMEYEEN